MKHKSDYEYQTHPSKSKTLMYKNLSYPQHKETLIAVDRLFREFFSSPLGTEHQTQQQH